MITKNLEFHPGTEHPDESGYYWVVTRWLQCESFRYSAKHNAWNCSDDRENTTSALADEVVIAWTDMPIDELKELKELALDELL